MATPISYGIGLSDQQVQAMLNSDVPEVRQQAETYLAAAQQPQQETTPASTNYTKFAHHNHV